MSLVNFQNKMEKLTKENPQLASNLHALADMTALSPQELYGGNLKDKVISGAEALKKLDELN